MKVSRQVRTLVEGSFVDRRENLLLFGKTGTGKTHLLSAIAQELVRPGGAWCRGRVPFWFKNCSRPSVI